MALRSTEKESQPKTNNKLEASQRLGYEVLHGHDGDGLGQWQQARDLSFRIGLRIHLCRVGPQYRLVSHCLFISLHLQGFQPYIYLS